MHPIMNLTRQARTERFFKEIFAKLLKEGLSPDQAAARAIQIIQSGKTEVASDEKMQVDQPRKCSLKSKIHFSSVPNFFFV